VTIDRVMSTTYGSVSGIKSFVNALPVVHNTLNSTFYGKKVDLSEFHKILGHCDSDRLEKTTETHNLKLNGEYKTCEQCTIVTTRQKNVKKDCNGGI
jgi:hypothetical protein